MYSLYPKKVKKSRACIVLHTKIKIDQYPNGAWFYKIFIVGRVMCTVPLNIFNFFFFFLDGEIRAEVEDTIFLSWENIS